jgi:predicted phosphodiesterase
MRIAVISDIHSNLPALRAVLGDVEAQHPDRIWCLGDLVGYGAMPDRCTELVSDRADLCLAGNHDLVVSGELDVEHFTRSAAAAARWTIENIEPSTHEFLKGLSPTGRDEGVGLYHGSPRDPVWEYVLSLRQARDCLELQPERVCLIGHSHVTCYFTRDGGETDGALAPSGTMLDLEQGEWLLNPGSVGQPRDGDPRASYMLLDTGDATARFQRVEYAVDEAAEAILAAGLPADLAQRLYSGH